MIIDYDSFQPSALTVKDLPSDEQPRERVLKYGIESLSNADLFAIILRTGTKGYPVTDICRDLMRINDNKLLNLERKTRDEIMQMKGVGELKAMQIEAVMEIVRRYGRERLGERIQIKSANDIFKVMRHEIGNLPHEEMWVLFCNRSNFITGKMRVSQGGSSATVFDVRTVLRNALHSHAESIVLCHNHPSGNLRPSPNDDAVTRKCRDACKQIDIRFLDHVVVTTDGYFSYHDSTNLLD